MVTTDINTEMISLTYSGFRFIPIQGIRFRLSPPPRKTSILLRTIVRVTKRYIQKRGYFPNITVLIGKGRCFVHGKALSNELRYLIVDKCHYNTNNAITPITRITSITQIRSITPITSITPIIIYK